MGARRPEGQIVSNLMGGFNYFGLEYREAWKLLMDAGRWRKWKEQNGFLGKILVPACPGQEDGR